MKTASLETIDIAWNPIGNDGFRTLTERLSPERLSTLKCLECTNCDLEGGAGGRALGQFVMKTSGLETLIIGNSLGNDGLNELAESVSAERLRKLRRLECFGEGATGCNGGRALAHLVMKTTALEELIIRSNEIGGDGLAVLAESVSAEKLTRLWNLGCCSRHATYS
eukprot:Filipodium_phascolosomae@DN5388_c0_g1_i1.p1